MCTCIYIYIYRRLEVHTQWRWGIGNEARDWCCEQSMPHIYTDIKAMDSQYPSSQLTFSISGSVPSLSASTSLVRLPVLSHSHRRILTGMLAGLLRPERLRPCAAVPIPKQKRRADKRGNHRVCVREPRTHGARDSFLVV